MDRGGSNVELRPLAQSFMWPATRVNCVNCQLNHALGLRGNVGPESRHDISCDSQTGVRGLWAHERGAVSTTH